MLIGCLQCFDTVCWATGKVSDWYVRGGLRFPAVTTASSIISCCRRSRKVPALPCCLGNCPLKRVLCYSCANSTAALSSSEVCLRPYRASFCTYQSINQSINQSISLFASDHMDPYHNKRKDKKINNNNQCHCGAQVDAFGRHDFVCKKAASRSIRHHAVNELVTRALSAAAIPNTKQPQGLCRSDGKRPDRLTLVPWQSGRTLVWDVTVVCPLADSYVASAAKLDR